MRSRTFVRGLLALMVAMLLLAVPHTSAAVGHEDGEGNGCGERQGRGGSW